jgi:hypothetical protein
MPTSAHLVIDGSNIATEGRSLPSLQQLDEAVRALLKERPHETWTVVVDATFGHRIDSAEKQMYEEALAANELVTPPAGTIGRGDKFLLEIADRANATVFSNDSFQEFHGEYEWLFDEGRLVGGKPVPEVGWIFTARTPVRGPKSRMASRMASERRGRSSGSRGSRRVLTATEPLPVPSKPPPRNSRRQPVSAASVVASAASPPEAVDDVEATPAPSTSQPGRSSRSRQSASSMEAVNEPLPFIEFIAEHGPGSVVKGEVVEFTSHGAFVQVGDVRCYLALKLMGEPAPRSARDVLPRGEVRDFVVHALDAPRRGIDLALPTGQEAGSQTATAEASEPEQPRRTRRIRQAPAATGEVGVADAPVDEADAPRRRRVRKAVPVGVEGDDGARASDAQEAPSEHRGEEEPGLVVATEAAPKKAATRKKAATKKAPAKKTATKKAAAKKAGAKKAGAKKAEAKKAPAKRASAKKAPVTKATAKKATVKKGAAKKATPKKAPVRKAAADKAASPGEAAGSEESP